MAVPKTAPRTILLKGRGVRLEKKAGGTITPGMLVTINSSDELIAHATAKGHAVPSFAVESENLGNYTTGAAGDIDTNYVSGDFVQAEILRSGDEVNALVAASAAALVIGDYVESAGDGTVRKITPGSQLGSGTYDYTPEGHAVGQCIKAIDNSANGASTARCQIRIL